MQHPEQQRRRGPGSPPADAPARPCCSPLTPLVGRSWRGATSGVRGCPGKLHRSMTKNGPINGAVFCHTRCVACYPSGLPAFHPFSQREPPPAGHRRPAPSEGRERRQRGHQRHQRRIRRHSRSGEQQAPASPYDARPSLRSGATATRPMRRRRGNHAPQEGPPPDGPPTDGGRRGGGRPRAPESCGYRFGTTASK